MGVALTLTARHPGTEFRPCVVYNQKTGLFVMWYEDRGGDQKGYAVATSQYAEGPFETADTNVVMPGRGRTGDYNIFVDDDGVINSPRPPYHHYTRSYYFTTTILLIKDNLNPLNKGILNLDGL